MDLGHRAPAWRSNMSGVNARQPPRWLLPLRESRAAPRPAKEADEGTGRTNRPNEPAERTGRTNRPNEPAERTGRTNRQRQRPERKDVDLSWTLTEVTRRMPPPQRPMPPPSAGAAGSAGVAAVASRARPLVHPAPTTRGEPTERQRAAKRAGWVPSEVASTGGGSRAGRVECWVWSRVLSPAARCPPSERAQTRASAARVSAFSPHLSARPELTRSRRMIPRAGARTAPSPNAGDLPVAPLRLLRGARGARRARW
jgi:hypothetical protein